MSRECFTDVGCVSLATRWQLVGNSLAIWPWNNVGFREVYRRFRAGRYQDYLAFYRQCPKYLPHRLACLDMPPFAHLLLGHHRPAEELQVIEYGFLRVGLALPHAFPRFETYHSSIPVIWLSPQNTSHVPSYSCMVILPTSPNLRMFPHKSTTQPSLPSNGLIIRPTSW